MDTPCGINRAINEGKVTTKVIVGIMDGIWSALSDLTGLDNI